MDVEPSSGERAMSRANWIMALTVGVSMGLLLWILLIGAKLLGEIKLSWVAVFSPFYGVLLAWLFFVILDARRKWNIGQRAVVCTFVWLLVWLLMASFTWMLVSNLDAEESGSWIQVSGPIVIVLAVFAVYELTTCFGNRGRVVEPNIFLKRNGPFNMFLWLSAEIFLLVFVVAFAHKFDVSPKGLPWAVIFSPLWAAFFFLFGILSYSAATCSRNDSPYCNVVSVASYALIWVAALVFFILLNVKLSHPKSIHPFAVLTPALVLIVIFAFSAACARKRCGQELEESEFHELNDEEEEEEEGEA